MTSPTHHTAEDAANAFDLMSTRGRLLLLARLEKHSRHSSFSSPRDMLSEIVNRTIDGRRMWPIDVDFETFVLNAGRSLASSEKKRADSKNISIDSLMSWEEDGHEAPSAHLAEFCARTASPSAEDEAIEREQLRILAELVVMASASLAKDEVAQRAAEGYVEGKTPAELRTELRIDAKTMRAAGQRAQRAFANARRNMKY